MKNVVRTLAAAVAFAALAAAPAALATDLPTSEAANAVSNRNQGGIIGTWFVTVPPEEGGDPFYAYQTFSSDGTFVETSSLLGGLTEGPAHGVWRAGAGGKVTLTFELFGFAPDGTADVRIRVRAEIVVRNNVLEAEAAVDILDLATGEVIAPNVATGPFSGSRLQPLGL